MNSIASPPAQDHARSPQSARQYLSQVSTQAANLPRAWQHKWIQKKLAADIAKSAQTVEPTEGDIAIANMRYAEAQRAADDAYELTHNVERVNRRWSKRK